MTKPIHRKLPCGKASAHAAPIITGIQPGDREAYEKFQAATGSERTRLFRANRPAIFRWQKVVESGSHGEASSAAARPAVAPKPAARVQAVPSDPLAALRADFQSRFPARDKDVTKQVRFVLPHCAKIIAAVPGRFPRGSKANELRTAKAALTILREKS